MTENTFSVVSTSEKERAYIGIIQSSSRYVLRKRISFGAISPQELTYTQVLPTDIVSCNAIGAIPINHPFQLARQVQALPGMKSVLIGNKKFKMRIMCTNQDLLDSISQAFESEESDKDEYSIEDREFMEASQLENGRHRVRNVIKTLRFRELMRLGIVPDLSLQHQKIPSKRYPKWVEEAAKLNKLVYSQFGLFLDKIIGLYLTQKLTQAYDEIWRSLFHMSPYPGFGTSYPLFNEILQSIGLKFPSGMTLYHEPEISFQKIEGHPDLLGMADGKIWILDMKTTKNFMTMADETYLQILSYAALARANGNICNSIGVLLTLHQEIIWFDITNWDSKTFLQHLLQTSYWMDDDLLYQVGRSLFIPSSVGSHVRKEMVLAGTLTGPTQVFLENPQGFGLITTADANALKSIVQHYPQIPLFVHGPYVVNFAKNDPRDIKRISHELSASIYFGGKGVVIHVGKYLKNDIEESLNIMEVNIRGALEFASAESPLLIETPAGQGTELLTNLEEFISFYERFDGDPRLRICVDTCHVFSLGYDPAYYIQTWIDRHPEAIILVHFNDSKHHRGCHLDRHSPPGLGFIGKTRMKKVYDLCSKHGIPMVVE